MTDTLGDRAEIPPPGLFDLGIVEEQEQRAFEPDLSAPAPRRRWRRTPREPGVPVPPLTPRARLAQGVLVLMAVLSFSFVVELVFVSGLQQRAAQQELWDSFRRELAEGTAPVGPNQPITKSVGSTGVAQASGGQATASEAPEAKLLAPGSPVAYLEIPSIGLVQVVVEGTSSGTLFDGPGHRRDSPLPGQEGTSVIMGRRAAFGGPFANVGALRPDDEIQVTTGQGVFEYRVIGVRRSGEPVPEPPEQTTSRLLLVTADGPAFFPDDALRVDAELVDPKAVGAPPRPFSADSLPASERIMASDTSTLYALVLWLQALVLVLVGAAWASNRFGRAKTWVIFLPPLVLVSLAVSAEVAKLLPNLT